MGDVHDENRPAATSTSSPTPADSVATPGTPVDEGGYSSAMPLLMIGAAGEFVELLALALADNGYGNDIADGRGSFPPVLDDALMRQVVDFQHEHGIDPWSQTSPDATNPPVVRRDHSGVVDAATWEALLGRKVEVKRGRAAELERLLT
jgi:peptidoglycan hydrolase-like protein with peptidoglycan-binding domain